MFCFKMHTGLRVRSKPLTSLFTFCTLLSATLYIVYIFPFLSFKITGKTKEGTGRDAVIPGVILNTYMRSGFTIMGRMLSQRTDVFYVFEPFWRVAKFNFYKGSDLFCDYSRPTCTNITEMSRQDVKPLHEVMNFLRSIFSCSFHYYSDFFIDLTFSEFQNESHDWTFHKHYGWEEYKHCRTDRNKNIRFCLKANEPTCKNAEYGVVKVLRMALGNLEPLLQENPNLRVVHLFRDPRGIINSHIHTGWYPVSEDDAVSIYGDVRVTCERLCSDLAAGKQLITKYPNQVKLIQYEDLDNFEEQFKVLYKFLELPLTAGHMQMIRRLSKMHPKGNKGFHPYNYRITLPWNISKMVENECAPVLEQLGYTSYRQEKDLRDLRKPPSIIPLPFALIKN